jgi:hypothetical protein
MVNLCGKTLVVTGEPGLSNVRRDASRTDRCRHAGDIDLAVSCKRGKGQPQGEAPQTASCDHLGTEALQDTVSQRQGQYDQTGCANRLTARANFRPPSERAGAADSGLGGGAIKGGSGGRRKALTCL